MPFRKIRNCLNCGKLMGKSSHNYCNRCNANLVRLGKLPFKHPFRKIKEEAIPYDIALQEESE